MLMQWPQKPEGIRSPSMRATDGRELLCGCAEEQFSGRTATALTTEPSHQPQADAFKETHPSSKNKDSKGIWVVGCSSCMCSHMLVEEAGVLLKVTMLKA